MLQSFQSKTFSGGWSFRAGTFGGVTTTDCVIVNEGSGAESSCVGNAATAVSGSQEGQGSDGGLSMALSAFAASSLQGLGADGSVQLLAFVTLTSSLSGPGAESSQEVNTSTTVIATLAGAGADGLIEIDFLYPSIFESSLFLPDTIRTGDVLNAGAW